MGYPADTEHDLATIEESVSSCEAALILARTPDSNRLMARRGTLVTAVATRAGGCTGGPMSRNSQIRRLPGPT
jgi:hypothetical protein